MKRENIQKKIAARAKLGAKDRIYVISDFLDLGNYQAVKMAISRLIVKGTLTRIKPGVYKYPYYSSFLGEYVEPSPFNIAMKIAEKNRWTIGSNGVTALNELGLSTQVPATYHFVSSGPTKKIKLDCGIILYFTHVPLREIVGMSRPSIAVIEAIKVFGKNGINDKTRLTIACRLSDSEKKELVRESETVRSWVREEILKIVVMACSSRDGILIR